MKVNHGICKSAKLHVSKIFSLFQKENQSTERLTYPRAKIQIPSSCILKPTFLATISFCLYKSGMYL